MLNRKTLAAIAAVLLLTAGLVGATSIGMKLSGPGAVNETTIKAGEPVTVDIYFENDVERRGFSVGFKITSPDIKTIVHPADSGNGLNDNGDIKAHNGWQDNSVWDMGGLYVAERDWDGKLPELVGFGGICIHKRFAPQKSTRQISFDLVVDEPGIFTIDSSYFPPTGTWMFAPPEHKPAWGGPYLFKVVE
ncbi:MAG: hypothetical protein KAU36_03430 [candidate division Zixibacteria bacterium]|nr:hypothetical protein [candidate division Zixibacteria bacterium]